MKLLNGLLDLLTMAIALVAVLVVSVVTACTSSWPRVVLSLGAMWLLLAVVQVSHGQEIDLFGRPGPGVVSASAQAPAVHVDLFARPVTRAGVAAIDLFASPPPARTVSQAAVRPAGPRYELRSVCTGRRCQWEWVLVH